MAETSLKDVVGHDLTRGHLAASLRHTTMTNVTAWEPQFQSMLKRPGWRFGRVVFKDAHMEERWLK